MREILLINPRKKRKTRKAATKRRKPAKRRTVRRTVAKRRTPRRTTRKAAPRRNTTRSYSMAKRRKTKKRRSPRRNPRRSTYKRAAIRARSTLAGLNIKSALKDQIPIQIGMFGTKFFAKLFGPEATEVDPGSWNWASYAKGAAGAVATAFVAQTIKPGMGQKVLQGGLSLIVYKMIQNNLVAGNEFAETHFGLEQEEGDPYMPDEYTQIDGYEPGDVEDDDYGNSYMLGEDYQWQQLPESGGAMLGDDLQRVGPLGASYEALSPPGSLGSDPVAAALLD